MYKLSKDGWRFELFYWDYVIGILAATLIIGLTLGSAGTAGRSFIPDILQASKDNITLAMVGGVIFNAANILLGAAISIAGMSVAFPVGIGLALVIGVVVNYLDNPIGDPLLLFVGVILVIAAILLNAYAYKRMTVKNQSVSKRGLILALISGSLMGLFYKYVASSMFTDFNLPEVGKLSPYSAVFFFAIGIFISNFLFNTLLMARPFVGNPVGYRDYAAGSWRNHLAGWLGGIIWCTGMALNIIASGKAGPAISYGLGQGATVVAALWGIFVWKEFSGGPVGTNKLLRLMLFCYISGLLVIIAAG